MNTWHKFAIIFLLCIGACRTRTAFASMVLCIYNSNAVYIASDSLVTNSTSHEEYAWEKTFKCGPAQIAAMTGDYGAHFGRGDTNLFTFNVLRVLQTQCVMLVNSPETIYQKQQRIFSAVSSAYRNYASVLVRTTGSHPEGCGVLVTGFDPSSQSYLSVYADIRGTNALTISTNFDTTPFKAVGQSSYVSILGETHFVPSLIRNLEIVPANEKSDALCEFQKSALKNIGVDESVLVPAILNIFRLHQKYAFSLTKGQDKGWIGEPYVIYRITSEGITKLR